MRSGALLQYSSVLSKVCMYTVCKRNCESSGVQHQVFFGAVADLGVVKILNKK